LLIFSFQLEDDFFNMNDLSSNHKDEI